MISGIFPMRAARAVEFEIFARDMAICGGLLLMIGMGGGPFAIDNRTRRRQGRRRKYARV